MSEPRLARHLTYITMLLLPEWSSGPRGDASAIAEGIAAAGFEGVQAYLPDQVAPLRAAGLDVSAVGRVDHAADVAGWVQAWDELGVRSITVHLGTGFETTAEGERLVEALLGAAATASVPVLLETHRATLTQDPARTLALVAAYPELRFTADLAHWYTGAEMTYGGFDWKLERLQPVLDRVRFVHGRVSDPGCAQVVVAPDDDAPHMEHFRRLWGAAFRGFLRSGEGDVLPFAPELLPPAASYARTVVDPDTGERREESDRWQQSVLLCELAEELFAEARRAEDPVPA